MKVIRINADDRRGKTPADAALLLLKELNNLDESEKEVRLILPRLWSWAENRDWMRRNMYELTSLLFEAVGERFMFGCECSETKELSITAKRY